MVLRRWPLDIGLLALATLLAVGVTGYVAFAGPPAGSASNASITLDMATAGLILGILNILGVVWLGGVKYARIELKTNTMWDFIMAGAKVEARLQGVIQAHSPLRLRRDVAAQFGELGRQIKKWYVENSLKRKSDSELSLLLVTVFGDALVEQVCLPLGLNMAIALMAAIQLCREEDEHV